MCGPRFLHGELTTQYLEIFGIGRKSNCQRNAIKIRLDSLQFSILKMEDAWKYVAGGYPEVGSAAVDVPLHYSSR